MESKSRLKPYITLGIGLVAAVLFIYREAIFQPAPPSDAFLHQQIPNFELSTGSAPVGLHTVIAQKTKARTIIGLWATWCAPCVQELPLIEKEIPRLAAQNTSVILINYDGGDPKRTVAEVKAWLIAHNLKLDTYFDFGEKVLEKLQISALPFAIGVGEGQKIQWMEMGELDWTGVKAP